MKGCLKAVLILFGVLIVLIIVGVIAIKAVFPDNFNLISLLNNKPTDLGVTSSNEEYESYLKELNLEVTEVECTENCVPKYSKETAKIEKALTNEEGSSLINGWGNNSRNAPFSDAQMRVNQDGTVEFSGKVITRKLKNFLSLSNKLTAEESKQVDSYISMLGGSFPVYAKGTLEIINNKVDLNITSIKISVLPLPTDIASQYKGTVDSYISNRLDSVEGLKVEKLEFKEGKTFFKGELPKSIELPVDPFVINN